MLSISLLITALTLVSPVFGHAEVSSPFANHPAELARRQVEMNKRHIMARDCASQVADYHRRRKVRRALRRRNGGHAAGHANIQGLGLGHGQQGGGRPGGQPNRPQGSQSRSGQAQATSASSSSSSSSSSEFSSEAAVTSATDASTTDIATTSSILEDVTSDIVSSTSSAAAPHYSTIQNTCVTAPEVTEGLIISGTNMSGGTFEKTKWGRRSIWILDARGEYSAFGSGSTTGNSTTGAGGGAGGNGTMTGVPPTDASGSTGGPPTQTGSGAMPSGSGQPGGGGGGGGGSSSKANGDNFLRGGLPADSNGIVEMTTLYPGFYTGRTVHIHTMIHQNITYHTNG
ncbi:hypothetical protein FS842_000273 [Serendipita sp. 407]|nr:hypothetical protein FS842_000273 [Serendipita sp. 407]